MRSDRTSPDPVRWAVALLFLVTVVMPTCVQASASPLGGALEEAASLLRSGRYQEAEERFRGVLEDDPFSLDARHGLAASLASRGRVALEAGDLEGARQLVEEAIKADDGQGGIHYLLAVILVRQADYYYARYAVRRALDLEPENAAARELLGDIQYQDGYHDLAIAEWEAALPEARVPRMVQAKIDRARTERGIEDGLRKEVSRDFVVWHDDDVPRAVFRTVLDDLEDAYDTLRRELGSSPVGEVAVILYSREAFREVTRTPAWVGGTYDGKIRIPVGGLSTERDAARLKPILVHELTHAFLRNMVPQGLPIWFNEGLAEHFEGASAESARAWLAAHRGNWSFAGLAEVETIFRVRGGPVEAAYAAAALAVAVLIEEEGMGAVRRTLEAAGAGARFDAALEEGARLTTAELEDLWRRELP